MGKWDKYKKNKKNKNKQKNNGLPALSINCLPCIYTVHHLNPYKMGVFKN